MLSLGYKASAEQLGPTALLELAVLAEEHGFDSVVVSDHFHPWKDTDGHAPFSFAWLGAAGASTKRIRIGTSVVTPTFRYNPAIVAQAMATLGCLFPDRVLLGVGTGESMNETPVTGMDWPAPGERLARLKEAITVMRRLWTEEYVTFEGKYYRLKEAKIFDKPARPVPLYVAASGPKAAEYAGGTADGFICTSGKGMELYRDTLLPAVASGARSAGRPMPELMIEMKVCFETERRRALLETREWAALALPAADKAGVEDPREMERRAAGAADRAHERFILSTDPDEHVERIKEYTALGFTNLVFHFPGNNQARAMRLYAKEILPRLRAIS